MNSSILVAFVCLFNTYSVPGYAVMRIGWLAGIIGLNLCFSPTPRVGRASNSIKTLARKTKEDKKRDTDNSSTSVY